jgi:hypothetical protein
MEVANNANESLSAHPAFLLMHSHKSSPNIPLNTQKNMKPMKSLIVSWPQVSPLRVSATCLLAHFGISNFTFAATCATSLSPRQERFSA